MNEFREWTMWIMELGILIYVGLEYHYDKNKDDLKKQKRTRTIKKTTTQPDGDIVVEETSESMESKGESNAK